MKFVEASLRGMLAGLLLFLTASGALTVVVASPSHALQFLQLAHLEIGHLAVAVGLLYLVVHLAQVFGVGRLLSRRLLRLPVALSVACGALLLILSQDLQTHSRLALNLSLLAMAVATCGFAMRATLRVLRSGVPGSAISGAATLVVVLVACMSGLLVSAGVVVVVGTERDGAWLIHTVSSPVALGLTLLHIAGSRAAGRREVAPRPYQWGLPLFAAALPVVIVVSLWAASTVREGVARVRPLTVATGTLLPTDTDLAGLVNENCAICHEAVIQDWSSSAHALAAANPVFTAMIRSFYEQDQRPLARFCMGCHAPHALDPTEASVEEVLASEGFASGVHCVSCHRSESGPGHGDGSMQVKPLALDEFSFVTDGPVFRGDRSMAIALISSRLGRHLEQFRFESHEETSCLPCHVQTMSEPSAGRLHDVLQDQYDSWTRSPAAEAELGCKGCHMPPFMTPEVYSALDHRFLGGSSYLAWLAGGASAVEEIVQTLQGNMPLRPKVFGELPAHDARPPLEMQVDLVRRPSALALRVRTRNTGRVGHSIPNGPTDILQFWLSVRVANVEGELLMDIGADGPEGAPRLGHRFLDEHGILIEDHRLKDVATVAEAGSIPEQGWHELFVDLPRSALPPLRVEARWNYRRMDPDLVLRLTGVDAAEGLPIVAMAQFRGELASP